MASAALATIPEITSATGTGSSRLAALIGRRSFRAGSPDALTMRQENPDMSYPDPRDFVRDPLANDAQPARNMQAWASEAVQIERQRGGDADAVVSRVARLFGVTPRRIVGLMRGEIGRVWADEYLCARRCHARLVQQQAERAAHEAMICRQRAEALKDRLR